MAVAPPADPRDVQDFQFKLLCRLRIFTTQDGTFTKAVNLVAPASKYGLVFVGCPAGVQVILSSSIIGFQHPSSGSGGEISTYPRREIPLSSQPSHLSVSCDQNYLVVAVKKDSCDHAYIYSVPSFMAKDIILVSEVRLSTKSDTYVLELTWNPGILNILAACLSDGSMVTYELKTSGVELNTLPPATQATCFCWSPKGKQLVVGSETGTLTQYKPDLKAVKTFPAPSLGSGSVAVVNVVWLSNYQFAAVYRDKINIDERPGLLIVNAPKAGTVSFVNYEDICYSAGDLRLPQFYLVHQPIWNILMVASANSMEVGVLGLQEDQISWEQWTQEDAGRAELPLSVVKQETFPIGFGLDVSTQHELPWGENQSLPPMPILHILSHQGVLCLFYAVNLRQNAACICLPPEKLPDESGLAMFTTVSAQLHMAGETSEQPSDSTVNAGLGNIRVNLTQKFESISKSQGNSGLFSFGTSLSGTSPGLTSTTSSSFVTLPASMTPSTVAFGACLTSTKPTDFITKSSGSHGAEHTSVSSTMFGGAPSTGFSTGLGGALPTGGSISSTELSNPATTNFGTGHSTPSSTFNIGFANPAPIHSSGAITQSFVSSGLGFSNPASVGLGNNPTLTGSSVPTSKPTFGFLSTLSAIPDNPNLKQGPTQTSNFSFSGPGVTSTPIGEEKSTTQQLQSQVTTKSQTGSVTITKVQPAGTTQMAKPMSDAKLQSETKHPAATLPSTLAISTSVFHQAIAEEVTHFERELSGLRSRVNGITIQVGSEDEKRMLHKKLDKIEEFWRELKETTQAQSQEIHSLKSVFMEAFAWVAEAKSRAQHLNSPMYLQVARSQALDPVSAQYAANIKHLVYYVENQLRQINEQLDNSWLDFQDSCKPTVKCKIHIPTLEAVYQAMVIHNNILNKQRAIMADVARRAQEQGSRTQIPLISSAVLARVRDKEASQLGKGETELSRLAENLVQMKLGPSELQNSYGMGLRYHRLTRKKESVLRHLLSQSTVMHVCPTKPQRSVVGGISTGKPVITMADASLYAVGRKKTIGLTLGTSTESISSSGIDNVTKSESVQAPLSLFGPTQPTTSLDASNKNNSSRNFEALGMKYVVPNKGLTTSTLAADGTFVSTLDSNKTKPISSDSTVLSKVNSQTAANIFTGNKTAVPGEFTFNYALQNGRNSTLSNFSYGMGLNKIPSVAKLNDASKRLEDYYEELTPPGSPRHSPKETIPAKGNPASNTFAFNFTLTPITTSSVTTSSVSIESFTSQTSPLMSLGSIVAGIGDGTTVSRITTIQASDKTVATLPSNTMGGSSFSFGSSSISHSQQGGSILSKPEDQKHSSETFRFSLPSSSFTTVSSTSQPVSSKSSISQVTPPKVSTAPTTSVNSQTPFLTSFGMENRQSSTPTQIGSIFGGSDNQTFPAFSGSGSTPVSSGSGNVFAQTVVPAFGGTTPVSPSKQPASSGNVFETVSTAPSSTNPVLDKQGSDSVVCTELSDSHQHKSESPSKDQCPVVTTSSTDSFFSQSATLFGSLSVGGGASPKPTSAGNIFGSESSVPTPANFIFGKQITTDTKNITSVAAETPSLDSAESDKQQSESSSKDIQPTPIKPVSTSSFNAPVTETTPVKPDSSGGTENKQVLNSPLLFGSGKPENTTSTPVTFSFSQLGSSSSSASTTQSSVIFGQTPTTEKPMIGSLFGLTSTSVTTTSPTSVSATIVEIQTTSTASTTFSFALPVSTSSSTPFTQKPTLFGHPVSSAAPTTTSNSSFFGQSICSPAAFGQSGGNIFGQSSTGAKTNIFGQTVATTSTPPVFGQTVATTSAPSVFGQTAATTSAPSVFGQTAATTSAPSVFGQTPTSTSIFGQSSSPPSLFGQTSSSAPFLGGSSTGAFGSKPVFGQSGGSIFGQSGSPGFAASGSSVFGGGSSSIFGGGSVSPSTGNLFQSSTGGSIFGGSSSPTSGTPGAFSSGLGQSISQSGFGSATAFQSKTAGAFGGSPVFERGTSGFGASPTFGGAPTFGGSPTFGSPGKVFGSTSPPASVGFGTSGQQSSTFETLATQNTMTFGNLAQNQGQGFGSPTQSIFGGTPPNTQSTNASAFSGGSGTFGGSSFSNWR